MREIRPSGLGGRGSASRSSYPHWRWTFVAKPKGECSRHRKTGETRRLGLTRFAIFLTFPCSLFHERRFKGADRERTAQLAERFACECNGGKFGALQKAGALRDRCPGGGRGVRDGDQGLHAPGRLARFSPWQSAAR